MGDKRGTCTADIFVEKDVRAEGLRDNDVEISIIVKIGYRNIRQ